MLTSIRIQNFRSIRDAEVKLGQVNLFIGPNNSGKSNFLKGIYFLSYTITNDTKYSNLKQYNFSSIVFRDAKFAPPEIQRINFGVDFSRKDFEPASLAIRNERVEAQLSTDLKKVLKSVVPKNDDEPFDIKSDKSMALLRYHLKRTYIFKPDPAKFQGASSIIYEYEVAPDASNLVSFIFDLSQNEKAKFKALESDLARCVVDLVSISTPVDPEEPGKLKLKFFDQNDVGYWAEEVSEGVLYFLALLCIVHQPDPPKLLLLEEPEKGIHPRRIKEVMDFIFELARLRDIQIILTSHSPYVVDHFADIPECISVFDRENGETVIRNAADVIAETNAKLNKPIRYSDALGEHWVSGFLGGVPV